MVHGVFVDDLVVRLELPDILGAVLLTSAQQQMTEEAINAMNSSGKIRRHESVTKRQARAFNDDGELDLGLALVSFEHHVELIAMSYLQVKHRRFNIGDIVKLNPKDAMSGTVIGTVGTCDLQPLGRYELKNEQSVYGAAAQQYDDPESATYTARPLLPNIPIADIQRSEPINMNSIVIYKEHVGSVAGFELYVSIRLCNGSVVEVHQDALSKSSREEATFHVGDFVNTKKRWLREGSWIFGQYDANVPPLGTIVRLRNARVFVEWLHHKLGTDPTLISHILEREELESEHFKVYSWTPRPVEVSRAPTTSIFEDDIGLGMRVRFRDTSALMQSCPDLHISRLETLGYDINVFDVVFLRSCIRVLWQDGHISEEDSLQLSTGSEPLNDEHNAWVGEVTQTVEKVAVGNSGYLTAPLRVGIVQSINQLERTASIRWCPRAIVEWSIIEDDDGGFNGQDKELVLNNIGTAAGPAELVSLYDIESPAPLNLCRGDLVIIEDPTKAGLAALDGVNWFGTVVDELLTGELLIRLSSATPVQDVILKREQVSVAIAFDEMMNPTNAGADSTLNSETETDDDEMDEDDFDDDDEYDSDEDMEENAIYEVTYEGQDGQALTVDKLDLDMDDDWESMGDDDENAAAQPLDASAPSDSIAPAAANLIPPGDAVSSSSTDIAAAYCLHEGDVPRDHRFSLAGIVDDSMRMKRIQKEHRILQKPGSLPAGVYVHAWDSRLDLLRVLFIGPEDTPYADAPFVIDFLLPATYPYAPPKASFHSWSGESSLGGIGPVNPNLYDEGKVCLSLLGTWEGTKTETWSHASTFLQVVVSIHGLVLVKEPYWNEPGYEEQMGTEEGDRAVMLYNERIVLRALNYAIAAIAALQSGRLLSGMEHIEKRLTWLYIDPAGSQLLEKLRRRVQGTLQASERGSHVDGLTVLSRGACISLGKVHTRLQQLIAAT